MKLPLIVRSQKNHMKTGLLVRVAIDSTAGNWNAPCSSDGRFCYVPQGSSKHLSEDHNYSEYQPFVHHLTKSAAMLRKTCCWPSKLPKLGHFDPNFKYCTYGDGGSSQRGRRIVNVLHEGDFIVFYAGLRDMDTGNLTYSIIGFYLIERIAKVRDISKADWHRNPHTDRDAPTDLPRRRPDDVVVFGNTKDGQTGRLYKHIPIGSYREGAWRVKNTY